MVTYANIAEKYGKSDKSKSSHESIDQLAMDIIHIKYQSIWNILQVNNTRKWRYWEFNYVSKTPQTLFPLQKRGLIPAVLATASDTSLIKMWKCLMARSLMMRSCAF